MGTTRRLNVKLMPTLRDVAKLAGVSHTTVSHVLNGTKRVRPEVADRVWAAVETLGYRLNRQAQALRRGQSRILGLILPDLTNPFFPGLAQAIGLAVHRAGYTLTLVDSLEDEAVQEEVLRHLAEEQVAGAIWVPVNSYKPPPFPAVLIDRTAEGVDGVEADHFWEAGFRPATRWNWATNAWVSSRGLRACVALVCAGRASWWRPRREVWTWFGRRRFPSA